MKTEFYVIENIAKGKDSRLFIRDRLNSSSARYTEQPYEAKKFSTKDAVRDFKDKYCDELDFSPKYVKLRQFECSEVIGED